MKFLKIVGSYVVNEKIYKYNIVFQSTILCSIKEKGIRFLFCYEKRKNGRKQQSCSNKSRAKTIVQTDVENSKRVRCNKSLFFLIYWDWQAKHMYNLYY